MNTENLEPVLPTRVLDLTRLDEFGELRLMESSGMRGQYAALTWCWGPEPDKVLKTKKETLSQRKERIRLDELNPLFQDVVKVCHCFHIKFLWIDALCIVQDDHEDWLRESGAMCDVYTNAFLTVSATSASSPNERLLDLDQRSWRLDPRPLAIPYYRGGYVYLSNRRRIHGYDAVKYGAVSKRGWCLQERYLSRRILHVAKGWYEWECLSTTQHETKDSPFPYDSTQPLVRPHGFEIESERDVISMRSNSLVQVTTPPYRTWYRVLEAYTARQMTHEEDRLPGIMGLADQFAHLNRLERDQDLICGLWKSDLIPGLMWQTFVSPWSDEDFSQHLHSSSEPAPSWSWLSDPRPKKWSLRYDPADIRVSQISGPARNAEFFTVTLQGFLIEVTSLKDDLHTTLGNYKLCYSTSVVMDEANNSRSKKFISMDMEEFAYAKDMGDTGKFEGGLFLLVFVLPVPKTSLNQPGYGRSGWGMLLTRVGGIAELTDHYKRMGCAEILQVDEYYPENSCKKFWRTQKLRTVYLV